VFHPILLPTFGTLLYLWANPSIVGKEVDEGTFIHPSLVVITIFINTFIMPAMAILMMKALGFIKSVDMEDRQDRIIPFIATMTFYIWAYLVVKNYFDFMLPIYSIFILGTVVSVMLSFFINLFLKLSIHMVGMAGLMAGTLLMMMNSEKSLIGVFLVIIVLTGLVASARLYLKAHTPKEVFIGFLIGISGQMLAFSIFNKFVNQIG
jgi:membrane-associated phospholipid phosphatase